MVRLFCLKNLASILDDFKEVVERDDSLDDAGVRSTLLQPLGH